MSKVKWAPTWGPHNPRAAWLLATGDVNWIDYGATWYRVDGREYTFVVFENCDDWGDGATGYHASVRHVDLDLLSDAEITSALRCCGFNETDPSDAEIACAALGYGLADVCFQTTGRHPIRVRAEAARWVGPDGGEHFVSCKAVPYVCGGEP